MAATKTAGKASSLDDFFGRIQDAQKKLRFGKGEECFFRGHPDAGWPLAPTLLRNATAQKWSAYTLRDTEADLYWASATSSGTRASMSWRSSRIWTPSPATCTARPASPPNMSDRKLPP